MLLEVEKYDDYSERNSRISNYNKNGWDDAKKDLDPMIRMNYYKKYGYNKEALNDSHHAIRFNAYDSLGWTKEALKDPCSYIKNYALIDKNLW